MMIKPLFVSIGLSIALKSLIMSSLLAVVAFVFARHYLQQNLNENVQELVVRDWNLFSQQLDITTKYQLKLSKTLQFSDTDRSFDSLIKNIEENWQSLGLIDGVEQIMLFDQQGTLLKSFSPLKILVNTESLVELSAQGKSTSSFFCNFNCYFSISAPLTLANGRIIIMLISLPAYPLLDNFFSISNTKGSIGEAHPDGRLSPYTLFSQKLSQKELLHYVSLYNRKVKNGQSADAILKDNNRYITLSSRQIKSSDGGPQFYLFWQRDVTDLVLAAQQSTRFAMFIMITAATILLLAIVLFHRNFTRRANLLSKTLPLLTTADFDKAIVQLDRKNKHSLAYDELDMLFDTSYQVTQQLQKLSRKLDEQNRRLHKMAYRDSLTGIPNRIAFYEILSQQIRGLSRRTDYLGLLFIDVDEFKALNDNFGHNAGDFFLINFSSQVTESIRQDDTVFRLAGDEFVVLVNNLSGSDDMKVLAEKILFTISQPVMFKGHQLQATISIGGIMTQDHKLNADYLIAKADEAMYASKKCGKGRYSFAGILSSN